MATRSRTDRTLKALEVIAGGPLTLGMLLRSIREGDAWSLADMAARLGVSRGYVANIEKGKAVSPKSAARYANALGYSEEQFVRLAVQDDIRRSGLRYHVELTPAARG